MDKRIDEQSPTWDAIQAWAEQTLAEVREIREQPSADLRRLDQALGSIKILKDLLALPAAIRKERNRDPIEDDHFNIPSI